MAKNISDTQTEISQGITIRGRVQGAEEIQVAGRIEGQVELSALLRVLKSGIVKADITAKRVSVEGIVVGDISAEEAIEIHPSARVLGDLSAPTIRVHPGARFSGALSVGDPQGKRSLPKMSDHTARVETPIAAPPAGFARPKTSTDTRRRKRVVVKKRS